MDLQSLIEDIRTHPGVTRKRTISEVIDFFPEMSGRNILAAYGEDAAVIEFGENVLLLAADGIMETLLKANPYFAGYYSILVNINDISAMGGIPLALVDVLSMKEEKVCAQVMRGMQSAVKKFGVPVVGGHTHPDCNYNAVDVAILGTARKEEVLYSHTAQVGDSIVFASDLDGYYPEKLGFAWDTTSKKDEDIVRRQMLIMNSIGRKRLAHAAKDISNPGSIGTLGMLLETSGKGGSVRIQDLPRPKGVDMSQWIRSYQGCGFVLTCPVEKTKSVIDEFDSVGVTAAAVGEVSAGHKIVLDDGAEKKVLFDFTKDMITGCGPGKVPRHR